MTRQRSSQASESRARRVRARGLACSSGRSTSCVAAPVPDDRRPTVDRRRRAPPTSRRQRRGRATVAATTTAYTPGRHLATFAVDGVKRTAVVVVPASRRKPAPVVFVFHGHGGTGANIERKFDIEALWPEAIVVYPYGSSGTRARPIRRASRADGRRAPVKAAIAISTFYDTMLASLRAQLPVDPNRVYAMGHSNGSGFVSLLLNRRGRGIAATANLSGQPSARLLATDPVRSMFMAMGMTDPIVPVREPEAGDPDRGAEARRDSGHATVAGDLRIGEGPRAASSSTTYIYPGGHEPPARFPGSSWSSSGASSPALTPRIWRLSRR